MGRLGEVGLAPVGRVAIAVGEPGGARSQRAGAVDTGRRAALPVMKKMIAASVLTGSAGRRRR